MRDINERTYSLLLQSIEYTEQISDTPTRNTDTNPAIIHKRKSK